VTDVDLEEEEAENKEFYIADDELTLDYSRMIDLYSM